MAESGIMNAVVTNVTDPQNKARIRFLCPVALGMLESEWALPAVAAVALPAVGAAIYVAFADGDLNRPVWFNAAPVRGSEGRITVSDGVVNIAPGYVRGTPGHTTVVDGVVDLDSAYVEELATNIWQLQFEVAVAVEYLVPTGTISPFGGDVAPTGWLLCNGGIYLTATYPDLYAVVGDKFALGAEGPGQFRVPDMRDKLAVGASVTKAAGSRAGVSSVTLTATELPSHAHTSAAHTHAGVDHLHSTPNHNHSINIEYIANTTTGGTATRVSDVDDQTGSSTGTNATATTPNGGGGTTGAADRSLTSGSTTPGNTGSTGSGTAFSVQNPYVAMHHIIKY